MATITFTLSESGGGLVSSPESQAVNQSDTQVVFALAPAASADYQLTGYTSTDTKSQLGPASINKDGTVMTLVDACTKPEQINITVLAVHRKHGTEHRVDPIVINEPPD